MDRHTIANGTLSATIKSAGAELCSLRDASGREYLWQAGPAWPRHAPVLFPIVGKLPGDRLEHDGRTHTLTQHGFARDQVFAPVRLEPAGCGFTLRDSDASRAKYPFAFQLDIDYALDGDTLDIAYTVTNPGDSVLPAAIGAHPGFRWPLAEGIAKTAHRLVFEVDEPAPVRRLDGGLLKAEREPTPIRGRILALDESLFAADALILDRPASRRVRFEAPGATAIEVFWDDGFAELGLWSKPGADFLCIEPWHGMASPVGAAGAFMAKPGLMHLAPGASRRLAYRIRLLPP